MRVWGGWHVLGKGVVKKGTERPAHYDPPNEFRHCPSIVMRQQRIAVKEHADRAHKSKDDQPDLSQAFALCLLEDCVARAALVVVAVRSS
jgi:hypothetical protein